ncbi:MAG: adenylate/guanylate cyclase domain-containing protein [Thermoleophilaceae bacterium]
MARLDIPARLYRRLGPRYLQVEVPLLLFSNLAVGFVGLVSLALYIDVSVGEFLLLLGVVWLEFWIPDALLGVRMARRHLAPVQRWVDDGAGPEEAWTAAATLPYELLRYRPFYVFALIAAPLFDVFAVRLLDLPFYVNGILMVGNLLVYAYWVALRFLGAERIVRPLLAETGERLPADASLPSTVSLRGRLLAALPALVVIGSGMAPGLASHAGSDAARLGLGVISGFVILVVVGIPVIQLLADSVVAPISALEHATGRVARGDFDVRVPVTSTDESGRLSRSFNDMVAGLAEREKLRETFGAYVDPEIAEHILKEGTNLGGEQVEVTVMFLDVRDFTGFAERSDAEDVVAALNRLWECVVPIVHDHQGHVDKFVGDGLLAVFGAPRRREDHADQAVRAALKIVESVRRDVDEELDIGVGVNSGSVVAGNVGGAGRLEFSVIGDAVNVAARVEAATRQTGDAILITDATRSLLSHDVELEPRGEIPLKGKSEPVSLYGLAPTSAASEARRPA